MHLYCFHIGHTWSQVLLRVQMGTSALFDVGIHHPLMAMVRLYLVTMWYYVVFWCSMIYKRTHIIIIFVGMLSPTWKMEINYLFSLIYYHCLYDCILRYTYTTMLKAIFVHRIKWWLINSIIKKNNDARHVLSKVWSMRHPA